MVEEKKEEKGIEKRLGAIEKRLDTIEEKLGLKGKVWELSKRDIVFMVVISITIIFYVLTTRNLL